MSVHFVDVSLFVSEFVSVRVPSCETHTRPTHPRQMYVNTDPSAETAPFLKHGKTRPYKTPVRAPPRRSLWYNTALLIVGDILGAGIIELPYNLSLMGWGIGLPMILVFVLISYYLGVLVSRLASRFSRALTFGDLAEPSCGRLGYVAARYTQQIYLVLTCGLYVLLASRSLQLMFYDFDLCQPIAGLWVILAFAIPSQLRRLHEISFIAFLSFVCIVGYILICVKEIYESDGHLPGETTSEMSPADATANATANTTANTTMGLAPGVAFPEFMSALMGVVFAFSGIEVYLEFIAEMRDPENFYKALRLSLSIVVIVYALVASYTYATFGTGLTPRVLTEVIREGPTLRLANGFLLVHLVATYCIKQQVVLRSTIASVSPENVDADTVGARLQWFSFSVAMLFTSWLLANAIPFFSDFCSLLGAFMDTTLCIVLPILIALRAHELSFAYLGVVEIPFLRFMMLFGVVLSLLGIVGTTKQLMDDWDTFGYPFSCMLIGSGEEGEG